MEYFEFDKTRLINLSYSLKRELIRSNQAGSFACTTIISSNTRKYHGLLVCPLEYLDGGYHVLLSALDETVIQRDHEFNLGIHKYGGDNYHPRGHKYLRDFQLTPIPKLIYRFGGVLFSKETLLSQNEERVLVRYTLIEAHSPTLLRVKPLLAFRNMHALSKANMDVVKKVIKVQNGIKTRMYRAYPYVSMQFSKSNEFVPAPDWNYNVEYPEEQRRGYDYKEDLYTPGFFELPLKKGESVIFSAGLKESDPRGFKRKFHFEIKKRIPRDTFHNCLLNASQQFIVRRDGKNSVITGFPWFSEINLRNTFASLPGLTLAIGDHKTFISVFEPKLKKVAKSFDDNSLNRERRLLQGVDIPLWAIWALQQYNNYIAGGSTETIWKNYGLTVKRILSGYRNGNGSLISMQDNGLLFCREADLPVTWMNSVVNGVQVTPRSGYIVEINALWYNAVRFALNVAEHCEDKRFIDNWKHLPGLISASFTELFYSPGKGYLADCVKDGVADWSVRPNQIFAASLPYSPLNKETRQVITDVVKRELLTIKGVRSLSPKNFHYKGIYCGDQSERDVAAHQGSVYPWLLGHFGEAYLRLYKKSGVDFMSKIFEGFIEEMGVHGIGTVSELYDGDPPHEPGGAVSYGWSVAELLRLEQLILFYQNV